MADSKDETEDISIAAGETKPTAGFPEWIWCVVANVRDNVFIETDGRPGFRHGTKAFSPKTKLYLYPSTGMDWKDDTYALGHYRKTSRIARSVIGIRFLESIRVVKTYDKRVIEFMSKGSIGGERKTLRVSEWDCAYSSREEAEKRCASLVRMKERISAEEDQRMWLYGVRYPLLDNMATFARDGWGYCLSRGEADATYGAKLCDYIGASILGVFCAYDLEASEWSYDCETVIVTDRGQIAVSSLSGIKIALRFDSVNLAQEFELFEGSREYGIGIHAWKRHGASQRVYGRKIKAFDWHCVEGETCPYALDLALETGELLRVGGDCDETVPEVV